MCDERRIRRALSKAGYALHKSRGPIHAHNLGGYMIVDATGKYVVAGADYELTLEGVEKWLEDSQG